MSSVKAVMNSDNTKKDSKSSNWNDQVTSKLLIISSNQRFFLITKVETTEIVGALQRARTRITEIQQK